MIRRAAAFYALHDQSGEKDIVPYPPDNQGVFDNAQMLYGKQILYDVIDALHKEWLNELLDICLDLYVRVTQQIKCLIHKGIDDCWATISISNTF